MNTFTHIHCHHTHNQILRERTNISHLTHNPPSSYNLAMDSVIGIIRSQFSSLRMPGPHDKVYNDECVLTFDR